MARISNMTIDGRVLSRLVIDGKVVSFAREPVTPDCLCFTAQEPNSTVKMVANESAPVVNLKTSRDGRSWTPYVMGADILLQNVDDKVYWKAVGSNERMATGGSSYHNFVMTGKIGASGNINSLLEEDQDTARTMSLEGKNYCYAKLFINCQSLTAAPELPATTLDSRCYYEMFTGCTKLNYIKVGFTAWNPTNATTNWLPNNVGKFECKKELIDNTTTRTESTVPPNWTIKDYDDPFDYLCFTAEEANSSIKLKKTGTPPEIHLQYSTDKVDWIDYTDQTITVANTYGVVYFRASDAGNEGFCTTENRNNYWSFTIPTGKFSVSGNIMTLLDNTGNKMDITQQYAFCGLFNGCTGLVDAGDLKLPATTIGVASYLDLFRECINLTTSPKELPALIAPQVAYANMFYNCTNMTSVPETVGTREYGRSACESMYLGCTHIPTTVTHKATKLDEYAFAYMFHNTEASNKFVIDMTECTSVPSLQSTTTFREVGRQYTIVVPDELYDSWINETNWYYIRSNIVKQSDYTA